MQTIRGNTKRYELTDDLLTGNELIDSEHRQLFDAVNDLMDACGQGTGRDKIRNTAEFLVDYVDKHFSDEENLQKKCAYPQYKSHHTFHIKYKQRLREVVNAFETQGGAIASLGELNQTVGILISHIRSEDKWLAAYLREHG